MKKTVIVEVTPKKVRDDVYNLELIYSLVEIHSPAGAVWPELIPNTELVRCLRLLRAGVEIAGCTYEERIVKER